MIDGLDLDRTGMVHRGQTQPSRLCQTPALCQALCLAEVGRKLLHSVSSENWDWVYREIKFNLEDKT